MPIDTSASKEGRDRRMSAATWLLTAILAILAGWTLRAVAVVAIPLVVALFVALAVAPVKAGVRTVMPRGLRWIGDAAAMSVVLLVLAIFVGGIYAAARGAAGALPDLSGGLDDPMVAIAAKMSDRDIAATAAYFAALTPEPAARPARGRPESDG